MTNTSFLLAAALLELDQFRAQLAVEHARIDELLAGGVGRVESGSDMVLGHRCAGSSPDEAADVLLHTTPPASGVEVPR